MRDSHSPRILQRLVIVVAILCAVAVLPFLSRAQPANSITIVNNSSRTIRYVYLSHVGVDDWTGNQIGNSTIGPGQSYTLNDVSCNSSQINVIGEDQDGCFVSSAVSCQSNASWTITNDTVVDCGN